MSEQDLPNVGELNHEQFAAILAENQALQTRVEALEAERVQMTESLASARDALTIAAEAIGNALTSGSTVVAEASPSQKQAVEEVATTEQSVTSEPKVARTVITADKEQTSKVERRGGKRLAAVAALGLVALAAAGSVFGASDKKHDKIFTKPVAAHTATKKSTNSTQNRDKHSTISTHQNNLQKAESASTAAEAVKTLHSTPETINSNLRSIFNDSKNASKHPKLDDNKGSMDSMRSKFKVGHLGSINGAEAVAFSVTGSPAYAAKVYNALHGSTANELPQGVSNEQALNSIEHAMTGEGTKFDMTRPNGAFINYGQRNEKVFNAGIIQLSGDKDVLTMTTADGQVLYFKESNLCTNVLIRLKVKHNTPVVTVTHTPETPKTTPKTPEHPQLKPKHPVKPKHKPEHPVTPKHVDHPAPKHDPNTTPGGVPGEPKGSGGNGQEQSRPQAGQAPSSVGQEQQPTPAPVVPENGESNSTEPAVTGTDNGVTGPAEQGNPGTENPAGQVNPSNTPSGD